MCLIKEKLRTKKYQYLYLKFKLEQKQEKLYWYNDHCGFDTDQAKEITNNIQHCDKIAKDNTNFVSNILYWSVSPTMDTKYELSLIHI